MRRVVSTTTEMELELTLQYPQPNAEVFILAEEREVLVLLGDKDITSLFTPEEIRLFKEECSDEDNLDNKFYHELELDCEGTWESGSRQTREDPGEPSGWEDISATYKKVELFGSMSGKEQDSLEEQFNDLGNDQPEPDYDDDRE